MEANYSIKLADGTVIDNLGLNGNNFISTAEISASLFEDNLAPVEISDGTTTETHESMELVQITNPVSGEYWFALRDFTDEELAQQQLRADLEYLAMMAGIDL